MTKIKGWYYDNQLNSPLTSATLHANMWWDPDGGKSGKGGFINWDQIKAGTNNGFGDNGSKCDMDVYTTITGAAPNACGYGLDPICTSIISEDFNIAISNTWSDFGGDPLGEMYNNLRGPLSAVAQPLLDAANLLIENNKVAQQEGGDNISKARKLIQKTVSFAGEKIENLSNWSEYDVVSFLNKALITNGTRFTYYGGTGIAFGNLGMKFTVFPKWKNNEFLDVQTQVTKLYPYFIGHMESFEDATGIGNGNNNGEAPSTVGGVAKEAANRCFMFQDPPGGYLTNMNGIDQVQRGTLKLKIGSFYEITNLVCSDVMLNFSKNMVKNPTTNEISPLFCDVNISLRPSTKYSDNMLKKFVGGSQSARETMKRLIEENLEKERNNIHESVTGNKYIIDKDYV